MRLLKFILIVFAYFILTIDMFAQKGVNETSQDKYTVEIYLQTGMLTFDFNSIITARNDALKKLAFAAKITDDFPNNPYFQTEINFDIMNKIVLGIVYSHFSTGSRIHYADYSGEYLYENVITNYNYGIVGKTSQFSAEKPLKPQISIEIGYSTVKIKEYEKLIVYDQKTENTSSISNTTYYVEPGISLNYFYHNFVSAIGVSYFLEPKKELTINYDGLRFQFTLGYVFAI